MCIFASYAKSRQTTQPLVTPPPNHRAGRDRRKRMRAESTGNYLTQEFLRFSNNSQKLRRLFVDTSKTIDEIIKGGYFNGDQVNHLHATHEQRQTIRRAIMGQVAILVFGKSCSAKAAVVNELFGSSILPVGVDQGPDESWRMVTFRKGDHTEISLSVPDTTYDLMEDLESYNEGWQTIPRADLTIDGCEDPAIRTAILEVKCRNSLLRHDVQVIVSPSEDPIEQAFSRATHHGHRMPTVVIYAVQNQTLSSDEEAELRQLKAKVGSDSVFFVGPKTACMCELTESEQHARTQRNRSELFKQLQNLGFVLDRVNSEGPCSMLADSVETIRQNSQHPGAKRRNSDILVFVRRVLQWMVVDGSNALNEHQSTVLNMFILSAFEFIRDRNITPLRIDYAKEREAELYKKLLEVAKTNQEEVRLLIKETITNLHDEILEKCANFDFVSISAAELEAASPVTREKCATQVQDFVLSLLSSAVADKLFKSMPLLKDSFVGTLERCLTTLEQTCHSNMSEDATNTVQASHALRQILNAAYQLEVTARTSSSILWMFFEKMRRMFKDLPGRGSPLIDAEWKQRVATDLLDSLSDSRLAKCICAQFKEKLESSHERFVVAMAKLKADHDGRIDHIKNEKDKIRRTLAPSIARYSLEAVSLRDVILYGMPTLVKEIGRGQYGVVYSCESWGLRGPLAIKSVVPPDDKHWNDLAMEFFYTRSLPPHDRIVPLRGSVIDYTYGQTPAVFLIMDRLSLDLHTALHRELPFLIRLRIAQDVVQGIRYLHSQGLVHRDIKLKNVLLDSDNRAKITDLGFCKPNAMISGSVVGTPIHMAPELFSQKYDNRVDTYAFGILFWYLCSGKTDLPAKFADCPDKDALWSSVRKGTRPERLFIFTQSCWELMSECWHQDPDQRPHLGDVENRIVAIGRAHEAQERHRASTQPTWTAEEAVEPKWPPLVH